MIVNYKYTFKTSARKHFLYDVGIRSCLQLARNTIVIQPQRAASMNVGVDTSMTHSRRPPSQWSAIWPSVSICLGLGFPLCSQHPLTTATCWLESYFLVLVSDPNESNVRGLNNRSELHLVLWHQLGVSRPLVLLEFPPASMCIILN